MKYKKSKYNYVVKTKSGYILYNSLYNSLSRLNEDEYNSYNSLSFSDADFVGKLVMQGNYVDEKIDELRKYNVLAKAFSESALSIPCITVTPTMECNARCFYCYENGVRHGKMREEDIDYLIRLIKEFDLTKGLNITWFGGEPLLNQVWMDLFAKRLNAENIKFSSFIITNGSKIDFGVIEKMTSVWNIKSIQITLDGSCEEYVKRKNYIDQDDGVYYKILRSIGELAKCGINVSIRLNVDSTNIASILSAAKDITNLYNDNSKINYYPAFLNGIEDVLSEREKIDFIKELIGIGNNFRADTYLYKIPSAEACHYYKESAVSIDSYGDIYTCEHLLGCNEKSIGNIRSTFNKAKNKREISGQREECQECVFFPKCHGGCYSSYINGDDPCFIDKYIIKAYLELL